MFTIEQKAEELYEKRIAPYARNISESQKLAIINFQKAIFAIDEYSEQVKDLDPLVLESLWQRLTVCLDELKVEKSVQQLLLQDIKDYADIEFSTRRGKRLLDYDIRLFYFKKSCDVRLQRHLIRYLNQQPPLSSEAEVVRDVLEEIEDDLDDIEEDRSTPFNGNRFLEALNSKDKLNIEDYVTFVNSLTDVPKDLVQRILKKISDCHPY